jgi:hypothetical protein
MEWYRLSVCPYVGTFSASAIAKVYVRSPKSLNEAMKALRCKSSEACFTIHNIAIKFINALTLRKVTLSGGRRRRWKLIRNSHLDNRICDDCWRDLWTWTVKPTNTSAPAVSLLFFWYLLAATEIEMKCFPSLPNELHFSTMGDNRSGPDTS